MKPVGVKRLFHTERVHFRVTSHKEEGRKITISFCHNLNYTGLNKLTACCEIALNVAILLKYTICY